MFGRKKEYQYQARIKELENIICPAEQHDFHVVDKIEHIIPAGSSVDIEYTEIMICKKCLKRATRTKR